MSAACRLQLHCKERTIFAIFQTFISQSAQIISSKDLCRHILSGFRLKRSSSGSIRFPDFPAYLRLTIGWTPGPLASRESRILSPGSPQYRLRLRYCRLLSYSTARFVHFRLRRFGRIYVIRRCAGMLHLRGAEFL